LTTSRPLLRMLSYACDLSGRESALARLWPLAKSGFAIGE
jgi:hypothetical protein